MLTTKEAAEILDVNPQTIRDYIHRGAIEAEKKGPEERLPVTNIGRKGHNEKNY